MTNPERRERMNTILGELAGSASMCWKPLPTGVFNSSLAKTYVDQALSNLEALWETKEKVDNQHGSQFRRCEAQQKEIDELTEKAAHQELELFSLRKAKPVMTVEEVEKVIFALKKARVFIEYARYELDDGKATIGSQFPHKEDADIETTRLKEVIDLASKLIGRE
jgi:ribosomal protein L29